MSRQQAGLRAPRPADAASVPSTSRRRPLYRCCDARHDRPWWFSNRTDSPDPGRFDLISPQGTCYLALSPSAAIIERTTDPDQVDDPVLSLDALAALTVWEAADVPAARSKLADTTRPSVPTLTAEVATVVPYTLAWAWADAFWADGRSGVLYLARFAMDESVALFGEAGTPDAAPVATPSSALTYADDLPDGFRAGLGTVGALDALERAPAP